MNILGTSSNIIATSRGENNAENWYIYNKDIRESTSSIIDTSGNIKVVTLKAKDSTGTLKLQKKWHVNPEPVRYQKVS